MSKQHSFCNKEKIRKIISGTVPRIHFIGALGIGMYPLFQLSEFFGFEVTGSDNDPEALGKYASVSRKIYIGKNIDIAKAADLAVYSLAVDENDEELAALENEGILCVSRAEYLGAIMEIYKQRITVSGSHGKSTVTAMLDAIFISANMNPTTVIGAIIKDISSPLRIGEKNVFICEACEYKDSFLMLEPTVSVFTNLELDHVDYFADITALKSSFLKAMNMANVCIVNKDDKNLASLVPLVKSRVVTFGEKEGANYKLRIIPQGKGKYCAEIKGEGKTVKISPNLVGRFNIMNAAAAAVTAAEMGIDSKHIEYALSRFSGIGRRLEYIGSFRDKGVYYDYAHHPTEIEAAITALKELVGEDITVIFAPHTYSRTKAFFEDFAKSLSLANRVFLLNISAIREKSIDGVSSKELAKIIKSPAFCIESSEIVSNLLLHAPSPIIIMGAANLDEIKREVLSYKGDA